MREKRTISRRAGLAMTMTMTITVLMCAAASCSSGGGSAGDGSARKKVVLDYSPTLSDAGALLYLASNPSVELVAVTLPGTGEADCEPGTRTTRALLAVAEIDDVPIGCGSNAPLIGDRDWPEEWRTEVNQWGGEMLPAVDLEPIRDAEELLVETLEAASTPLTLVAVGPLTNLGAVLTAHPELTDRIERIVIMGGAVDVAGNVEDSPTAEWNLYIDPEAARIVFAAGVPVTMVPLDATNQVPWSERLLARLGGLDSPAATTVYQLASSRESLDGFYLWDELAAMVSVEPGLVTLESTKVRIDDDGAVVRDPAGVAIDVAVTADGEAATDEFTRTLNGGVPADVVPLTAAELDYFVDMGDADARSSLAFGKAYDSVNAATGDPLEVAASFVSLFLAAVEDLAANLNGLNPPPHLAEAHGRYVDQLIGFAGRKDALLAALDEADGTSSEELLNDAMRDLALEDAFDGIRDACQVLEDYAFLHAGPRPCSAASGQ